MEKEKIDKLFQLVETLKKSSDQRTVNCATIIERLLVKMDDLVGEIDHLKEENERLTFELQDKRFEQGPRRPSRGGRQPARPDTFW